MSSLATLSTGKLELSAVIEKATACVDPLGRRVSSVTGASKSAEGWRVIVELVERSAVPDSMDLLGAYEVLLDPEGELIGYERIRVRRRCDPEERA